MYELVQFTAPVGSADWAGHALVRLTDVSEQPERAEITGIDGWGDGTVLSAEIRR
ncbi:hypothetical protein [Halovivax limisalsi]|uniref:hypothetical protein n=1 Tax=Halovivax limisalsi TaxID=1453760 RepID=UPI001FFD0D94|nr:hypothetical protein [Halovivax limisalsi]